MKCLSERKNDDSLTWKIKGDAESISIPGAYFERYVEFKKEISLDAEENNLLDTFSPCIEENTEKIDNFHSRKSSYCNNAPFTKIGEHA